MKADLQCKIGSFDFLDQTDPAIAEEERQNTDEDAVVLRQTVGVVARVRDGPSVVQ